MNQTWSPGDYLHHASFVPALGASVLERLAPAPGERILDLGCGDGTLTLRLVEAGAAVVAVDASPEMVAAACGRGIDARVMPASALTFDREFDAVFSNAVLHWVLDADRAIAGVKRALVPGGRFVAEFGGHGNIAAITVALRAVLARHQLAYSWPWYYPSADESAAKLRAHGFAVEFISLLPRPTPLPTGMAADEYTAKLRAHGFAVEFISLLPRPTPLPTGMAGWLQTFAGSLVAGLPPERRAGIMDEVVELLRPSLCDEAGQWTADYVRLVVVARAPV